MTNKIKLLLWSFLTIIFVWLSITYAYNLWDNAGSETKDWIIKNVCFKNWKFGYNNYKDWKCPDWELYIPYGPDPSNFFVFLPNPYPHSFFLNITNNGEWFIFRRSIRKNWGLSIKDFSFPSKSGFEYIDPKGKKSILTKVYYWHNTAYFFDPATMHWFSFIGDRALWNLFLVANPFKAENNLYLINFKNKVAYSKTVEPKIALQYMLWDPQYLDKIKEVKWETSYTLVPWWNEVLPPNFDTTNYGSNWRLWTQGEGQGWNYVEDLTLKSPNWYEGENKSNAEITGNNKEQTYEESLKEYNSCTSYWNNIKTYTTYDKECYRSLLDSAPLTWAVNHKKLLAPRNAVVNWNGEGELDIDTEDRICLQFKDRKAVYKQKRSKQWEEFLSISKENWLSPSWINIAEKCGKRPERSWSFLDKFWSKYQDRREYIELKVACLASFWVAPEVCKKLDDPNSKNSIIAENNKGRDTLNSWQNKPLLEPKEYILKAWNVVYDPFYSWYVNTTFLPAQCGSYKNDVFSIFAYLFLFSLFLYFIKFM